MLTTQKSMSAGNQQVTDARIPWLAGIIDAEGSIGIYKNGYGTPYVRVTITNTDLAMKRVVTNALEDHEIPVYIQDNQIQKQGWKPRWQMVFAGNTKPRKLLELTLPYLVTKRQEAELALEYIERRQNRKQGSNGRYIKAPLAERETEIIKLVAELKNVRHLRDYTRSA